MIEFGAYRYDSESRLLYRGDEEILLPPRVVAVLESLLKRPGKIVPKEDLLASAWEGAFVGEDSLTQAISQLRQALGDDPQRPTYIQTIPRRGYRLIVGVSEPLGELAPIEATGHRSAILQQGAIAVGPSLARSSRPLAPGLRLGRYEIVSQIGAGAMGEVWEGRDTELDRAVAIKVVPAQLGADSGVMERFQREAKMLAAVNHPNIATIFAVEEVDGTRLIVMELLRGKTLEQRLEDGPLPIVEALAIGRQVAEALASAHERGIIHRDLKPANVVVGDTGQAKVVDFGLAKSTVRRGHAVSGAAAAGIKADGDPSPADQESTWLASSAAAQHDAPDLTASGVVLGTAPYMSPEQVRGQLADKRADIWAFGCLLYEMLTGTRAFRRETAAETLAAILERDPDWEQLPADTPGAIRRLLHRCLAKDTRNRLHDIADARIVIEESLQPGRLQSHGAEREPEPGRGAQELAAAGFAGRTGQRLRASLPWIVAGGLAITLAITLAMGLRSAPAPAPVVKFDIRADEGTTIRSDSVAVSRSGTYIAYSGAAGGRLQVRAVERGESWELPDTEADSQPVFSPDEQWIAFKVAGSRRTIKRVSVHGGSPTIVATAPGVEVSGIDWAADGTIFLGVEGVGLMRVPSSRGPVELVVAPDIGTSTLAYQWPHVLPDGRSVLLDTYTGGAADASPIILYELDTGLRRELIDEGARPRYVAGNIVFIRRNTLYRVPFDLRQRVVTGDPVALLQGVYMNSIFGSAGFDISQTGSLVFAAAEPHATERRLLWVDRATGAPKRISEDRRRFRQPRLSPDERRLAVSDEDGSILIYDVERGSRETLTSEGVNSQPVWTPDGRHIAFSSNRDGPPNIYWQSTEGRGEAERLTISDNGQYPISWSPDGRILAFEEAHPDTGYDIMLLDLEEGSIDKFLATPAAEMGPMFSPDGRWLAYDSDESGRTEVYAEPFPTGSGQRTVVSVSGGRQPIWSRNGELFFRWTGPEGQSFWTVGRVGGANDAVFRPPTPQFMFEGRYHAAWNPSWDVSRDGTRFVLIENEQRGGTQTINVVLNWFEELKQQGLLNDGR